MKKTISVLFMCSSLLFGQQSNLIAYWSFDNVHENRTADEASNIYDTIEGNYKILPGVVGSALKCDGFTTRITRSAEDAPIIKGAFTVEAWVAPQAYPWNWGAIANQEFDKQRGYFFGF